MGLSAGTRLGPYEILAPRRGCGMGEVYRARDTKLRRDVAIKILPQIFTSDPERLARFEREAQMLAALNHSHIGAIYGVGRCGRGSRPCPRTCRGRNTRRAAAPRIGARGGGAGDRAPDRGRARSGAREEHLPPGD